MTGGVTATEAKVFVRTDQGAHVALRYGTDPGLIGSVDTGAIVMAAANDFTATIPLTGLLPETTYYLNVLVNGVPQFAPRRIHFSRPSRRPARRATSSLLSWPILASSPN